MSSKKQKQSSLSQWWKPGNNNTFQKNSSKEKRINSNNNNSKNKNKSYKTNEKKSRKRTHQQSNDENYPNNLPLKRPRKKAKTRHNPPKKHQIMEDNEEQDEDIEMKTNNNNNDNHNHNTNNNSDSNNSDEDTLSILTQFDFKDNGDGLTQRKSIQRDSKFKLRSNSSQNNKNQNKNNTKSTSIEGDFSKSNWFLHPKDKSGHTADHINYDKSELYIPPSAYKKMKPLRKQWWQLKSNHFDGVLFFKKGNFYQLFHEDAYIGHKITGLMVNLDATNTPHVGFPEQSFRKYAESFVKHGYKVYRAEQMENEKQKKKRKGKLMKRSVCEVLSKGTLIPLEFLDERANYILSIVEYNEHHKTSSIDVGICYTDFSTGDIYIGRFIDDRNRSRLRTLLFQINPSEVIYKKHRLSKETMSLLKNESPFSVQSGLKEDEFYDAQQTKCILTDEKYWIDFDAMPNALKIAWEHSITMNAVGGILFILQHTMHDREILPHSYWHIYDPTSSKSNDYLTLNGSTLANLEILSNSEGTRRGSLIEFLDHCCTKFGSRKLEQWLKYPLNKLEAINERLDAIEYLMEDGERWYAVINIKERLKNLPDLERLLHHLAVLGTKGRMMDKAVMYDGCVWNKRKVKKLIDAMDGMEQIRQLLDDIEQHRRHIKSILINDITTVVKDNLYNEADDDGDIKIKDEEKDMDEKKVNLRHIEEFKTLITEFKQSFDRDYALEFGIIKPSDGYDKEYDDLLLEIDENETKLQDILIKIKRKFNTTNIKYLHPKKAAISNTYLIEVPKTLKLKKIPKEWNLVGGTTKVDRYHSKEIQLLLKKRETLFDSKQVLERDCARAMFESFGTHGVIWRNVVNNISILDCLFSLCNTCEYAPGFAMNRPQFIRKPHKKDPALLEIRECRHPCVALQNEIQYIPNDTVLGCAENKSNFVLVTGPNMGGKSTLLRQTCIAVILAHIGCYVPCKSMRLTPVDRIFTRVGANDRILSGQSTFMVELEETSNILRHATNNSLVILDELGRGTSTFDGTAIAYAVVKMLIEDIGCRCLFSTHYHGLCDSFVGDDRVAMYHMTYKQDIEKASITFLYKFMKGICKESHGINCAKLAGLKDTLLECAKQKARILHERMHSAQDIKDEKEFIQQFKEIKTALFNGKLWQKIQHDLKK